MKRILYSTPKEDIELSYPDWLDPFMKMVWKLLKVKTVKLERGAKFTKMWIDELATPKERSKR